MESFVCIHGHFYQPPRENPWLEAVEVQDSAAPWHDWNERIAIECYAPNATARTLDEEGKIQSIDSNYARISFNFGPTVLEWMRDKMPSLHAAIVAADAASRRKYSGHGSALAQAYNHMILPLANPRDKHTQVLWGIRDFEHRFGRVPEGMWLPETAADTETLEALAEVGIQFTILSPFQARRYRGIGRKAWIDASGGRIDPRQPYAMNLPSGRRLAVFFYDGPVSQAVAFERLLTSGERFADRLLSAADPKRQGDQLLHIATDGESYGHHHRHGEMALAYALHYMEDKQLARLTNYGEYLEKHPPSHEVQIHEKSSWSCCHGVGRWMTDCGCNSGGHSGWNQQWRAPLRESFDWLRDSVTPLFERKAGELLSDPWKARDDYISVILDRSQESREKFLAEHARGKLSEADTVAVLKLMELQRHAMLMYTSCGWFFDELSGLETVQVIQYAARVLQLARELFGTDLEPQFLERLERARSNIPQNGNGRRIYEKFVLPARIDWPQAVAHYAISSVFKEYPEKTRIFSYSYEDEKRERLESGKTRLVIGRAKVISEITQESRSLAYAILYMGEHNLTGGVGQFEAPAYESMTREIKEAFTNADYPQVIRLIDTHFGPTHYSLKSLFKDEQRRILGDILASTRDDLESRFRLITERYTPLMKFLEGAGTPLPTALKAASDFILHSDIRRQFESDKIDTERLQSLLGQAEVRNGSVLDVQISYAIKDRLERMMSKLAENPCDRDQLRSLAQVATLVKPLPIGLNLGEVENRFWELAQTALPGVRQRASAGDDQARQCLEEFTTLGDRLGFARSE